MLDTQYYENFIDKQQSKKLYSIIFAEVPWQNNKNQTKQKILSVLTVKIFVNIPIN